MEIKTSTGQKMEIKSEDFPIQIKYKIGNMVKIYYLKEGTKPGSGLYLNTQP